MPQRHDSLIPLSHDHHHGLVLAVRLKKGTSSMSEADWPSDARGQAEYTLAFYQHDLVPHFRAEEEILFPAMLSNIQGVESLITELLEQHNEMRHLIAELEHPDSVAVGSTLQQLGEVLERHIRCEERELFPFFERNIAEVTAQHVGKEIQRIRFAE
jgi:hemerythrin-like domain-containing protein